MSLEQIEALPISGPHHHGCEPFEVQDKA